MNTGVHVSFSVLISSGHIPRSGIAGWYGGFIPSFLRNFHTVLHSGCINLHSHQQSRRVPFSSHLFQHFLFLDFLIMAILSGVKEIPHCSFNLRWSSDVDHLFICLLAICMSNLEKCLFRSFSHILIGLFVFLALNYMSCWYILDINPCQLFHLLLFPKGCLFTFL